MSAEAAFGAAVLDPEAAVPPGLIGPGARPAGRRFSVYRNTVAVTRAEALAEAFPVVQKLVGGPFFAGLARAFLQAHPPRTPQLSHWGGALPGFLESFAPTAGLPYLPDVARLELARRQAYHAADSTPVAAERLGAIDPVLLASRRVVLAPAVRVVRSRWPVLSIWRANAENGPRPQSGAEDVLVGRRGYDPVAIALAPGGADIVLALGRAVPLDRAAAAAPASLAPTFAALLAVDAILDLVAEPHG